MRVASLSSTPLFYTGVLLDCADGSNINPKMFDIVSRLENIRTHENIPVSVDISGDKLTFTTVALPCGTYLWKTVMTKKATPAEVWLVPIVVVEVG